METATAPKPKRIKRAARRHTNAPRKPRTPAVGNIPDRLATIEKRIGKIEVHLNRHLNYGDGSTA